MIRHGCADDLDAIAAIQSASPEAGQWAPADYLRYPLLVAVSAGRPVGFLSSRTVAEGEHEVLNLAVHPAFRRQGWAGKLLGELARGAAGHVFLEVRESNHVARKFYKSMGFQEISVRRNYYNAPPEDGIVMKFHSC